MELAGLFLAGSSGIWELVRTHKVETLLVACAFLAGGFLNDLRTDQRQQKANTEDIRQLKQSVRGLYTGLQNLSDGQERILCRLDGESAEQCEITTQAIPDVIIPSRVIITDNPTTVQDGTALSN